MSPGTAARTARAEGGPMRVHHEAHFKPLPKPKLHTGPIHAPVAGRTDHLPMHVPSGSYVLPSDVVSAHAEGNTIAAFKVLRRMFGGEPYGQGEAPYGQDKGPYGEHLATGGAAGAQPGVPIVAAGGEYVIPPHVVTQVGDGDMDRGHAVLDEYVKRTRANLVKTLKALPGPAKS